MRTLLLLVLLVGWVLLGATCLPFVGGTNEAPDTATTLGVTIISPTSDATVGQEGQIDVRWTAYNNTDYSATARLYLENRADPNLSTTVLAENVEVSGSVTTTSTWDLSTAAAGEHVIYAEVQTAVDSVSTTGAGKITVDERPSFEFTEPATDETVTQGAIDLTIAWTGMDREGTGQATIGIDTPDPNDPDHASGNEVLLHEATLADTEADGSFQWTGNDINDDTLDLDPNQPYVLFALVGDDVNSERVVDDSATITVVAAPPEPNELPKLAIVDPNSDTEFPTSQASLTIGFTIAKSLNVTYVTLKIDTDDNHTNGNEENILADRPVDAGETEDTWDWDGTFADGSDVPPGIYRLLISANTGSSTPQTLPGDGFVFRRANDEQPLVALLEPATMSTVQAGDSVKIRWRDDDPTGEATIRLALDDDPNAAEAVETDNPEIDVPMPPRDAAEDSGGADIYYYSVPALSELGPGLYYVFAYIDPANPGDDPQSSVAAGSLLVKDPTTQ